MIWKGREEKDVELLFVFFFLLRDIVEIGDIAPWGNKKIKERRAVVEMACLNPLVACNEPRDRMVNTFLLMTSWGENRDNFGGMVNCL